MTELPAYLNLKLKTTVEHVTAAARAKNLEAVLAYELFDLQQRVDEAVHLRDERLAKEALAQEQRLLTYIGSLPNKVEASVRTTAWGRAQG